MSDFRVQQLLPRLRAIDAKISGVSARFVHLVASDVPPSNADKNRLAALLTYGDPATAPAAESLVFIVSPRFGTVSPWPTTAD